jgi:protein-S-isoprenylcysteine O-methyltransferase Ste14
MNKFSQPWNVVFFMGFVLYLGIRGKFARQVKRNELTVRKVDVQEKLLMAFTIAGSTLPVLLYLFSSWLAFADYRLPAAAPWCGVAVMLVALWLFWRSHADLGLNWSVTLEIRKEHQLITHGIYRSIRHPMYAAIWLFSLAQALLVANWFAGGAALVVFAPMYFLRTPREERLMCEVFGQEYHDYMARTGRLWPRMGGHGAAAD